MSALAKPTIVNEGPTVRPLGGAARVWLLTALLAGLAGAVFVSGVLPLTPAQPAILPWYVLALLFFGAEVLVVHFQFRREVHTFSLSEIPFVIGLFFATPVDFVLANVLGAFAALLIHRRQAPIKLAFNTSQFALGATVGVTLFHLLRGASVTMTSTEWFAALSATAAMNLIGIATIAAAIALSEGRLEVPKVLQVVRFGLMVGITNAVVVLAAITFLWNDPAALWILGVPALALYLAYRAYISEREKHESLEFLYESTSILQRTPELDVALVELLDHTRRMFRAQVAELTLVAASDTGQALTTSLGPGDDRQVMVEVETATLGEVWARLQHDGEGFMIAREGPSRVEYKLHCGCEMRDALVAPLRGDNALLGMLVVANRLGDVSSFDVDDVKLLDTLARHAGIALENGRLGQSLAQLNDLKEQLRHQAFHDSLTGLGNRALFQERVAAAMEPAGTGRPVVLFVDLDDFKTVNDSLGHSAGDMLLVAVAERLRACLRPADLAARLGGDEFGILLEHGQMVSAIAVGERIMAALRRPFIIDGNEVLVRASVGIAEHGSTIESPDELLRNADVAMYTAKSEGKSRVAVFEQSMHAAVVARHALTSKLQRAVDEGQFEVHYQPIVNLHTNQLTGAEALVRWRQPDGSLTSPAEFMSLAEETGLILPLGRWVLETACRQAQLWHELAPDRPLRLAVNLSARQVQQPGFIDEVTDVLRRTALEPATLLLEITETVLMHETTASMEKLAALKQLGVSLAIDDFGTGYSSLSYLRQFPVDVLKMARPFVEGVVSNREDSSFASAIVALGHSLRLKVVAEGIETAEQLAMLRGLGCDFGQGFYFARAMPAEAIGRMLTTPGEGRVAIPVGVPAGRRLTDTIAAHLH